MHTTGFGTWRLAPILSQYRDSVNSNMLFVSVDLQGRGRSILGASLDEDSRNVSITGYSDSILRMISEI